jgi:phosphoribosylformimino-5-aminoimidazole carboxamide ribotide isomerase
VSGFELIPAIDILGGRAVRLTRGDYGAATVYDQDPAAVAARFAGHPIRRIHVVDLDGARQGRPASRPSIRAVVVAAGDVPVQLGGGLRRIEDVEIALELGVGRVVLGTAALRDPELVRESTRRFPGRVALAIDARDGKVAVQGWLQTSEASVVELAMRFEDAGVAALVYTDISRDGTLDGPNFEATVHLAEAVQIPIILSGGIASEEDVLRAAGLAARGVSGAIVGRALYTGALDLGRTLERLACC